MTSYCRYKENKELRGENQALKTRLEQIEATVTDIKETTDKDITEEEILNSSSIRETVQEEIREAQDKE